MTRNDEKDDAQKPVAQGSTEIARWADVAMYKSTPIKASDGPTVSLLSAPSDPLGLIAAMAKTYVGEFVDDLSEITDAERRHYLGEIQKTALAMPLESVLFNFSISGVTRGFTHQMVRQRTASYAQESTRFSVIEDGFVDRVGLPPSLAEGHPLAYWEAEAIADVRSSGHGFPTDQDESIEMDLVRDGLVERYGSPTDKARYEWEKALLATEAAYRKLVNSGIPAEDARGLLPTNITTRIKYNTNMRALLEHIGLRTCTQAQFEWRAVAFQMMQALRTYGRTVTYRSVVSTGPDAGSMGTWNSWWQFEEISKLFAPICYRAGKCTMKASFDRACSIRDRVDTFAANGIPSACWHEPLFKPKGDGGEMLQVGLPIFPVEWMLDPNAAR